MKHQSQLTVELRLVITGCEAVRFLSELTCCLMLLCREQSRSFKSIWYRELLDVRRGRSLEASLLLIRGRQRTSSPPKKSWISRKAANKVEPDLMYGSCTMSAEIWANSGYCMYIVRGLEAAASASRTFVPFPVSSVARYSPAFVIGGRYVMFQKAFDRC